MLVWAVLALSVSVPIVAAAVSPLLAWRQPIYIAAGFSGIAALTLLLIQPLLAAGILPGLHGRSGRTTHFWTGAALVGLVVVHVGGLWLVSPPDVIDALLFVSPTPFSAWGVIAMWALILVAFLATRRRRSERWRRAHRALAALIVLCSLVHALLVEGAMEPVTKAVLCIMVGLATLMALRRNRARLWQRFRR